MTDADSSITRETRPVEESVTAPTSAQKQAEEQPSIENLVTIVREIPTKLFARSLQREGVTDIQPTYTSTTTEEENKDAPTESVATGASVQQLSGDDVQDIEESSVESITKATPSTTTEDQADIIDQATSSKTTEITSITEATGETLPNETSKQTEAERLISNDVPLLSVHTITDEITIPTEDQIEQSITESSIPPRQPVTSAEVKVQERPADETPEVTKTTSITETIEDTPKQVALEELSWEALTGAVRYPSTDETTTRTEEQVQETTIDSSIPDVQQVTSKAIEIGEEPATVKKADILESTKATSVTETVADTQKDVEAVQYPSIDATPEKTSARTEEQAEQTTTDSSIPLVQQVTSTEVQVREEPDTIKQEDSLQSTKTTSLTETVEETPRSVAIEDLSWEALTGAIPYPSTDVTTDETTTRTKEQVTSTALELAEEPAAVKEEESLGSTNTTSITRTVEDSSKEEAEAKAPSSEALAGIVREILATPVTVHLPSAKHTTEITTNIQPQEDKPDIISSIETTEESEILTSSPLPTVFTSSNETVPKSRLEDRLEEVEAERLSTEALTEAVREIIHTPIEVRRSSADTTTDTSDSSERSTKYTVEETTVQAAAMPDTKALTHTKEQTEQPSTEISVSQIAETVITEETNEKLFDTKEQEVSASSKASPIIETVEHTTNEVESERPSSIASTEVAPELLATPYTDHSASLESKSGLTSSTTSSDTAEKVVLKSDQPSTNVEKTDEEEISTTITAPLVQTTPSDTTAVHDTSAEEQEFFDTVEEKTEETETLPTESLTKVASEILAGAFPFRRPSTEQIEEKPSGSIFGSIVRQIKDAYHDLTGTSEEPSNQKTATEENEEEFR